MSDKLTKINELLMNQNIAITNINNRVERIEDDVNDIRTIIMIYIHILIDKFNKLLMILQEKFIQKLNQILLKLQYQNKLI